MRWRLQGVGLLEIGELEEITAHLRHEENNAAEHEQEHAYGLQVMHRVVGVESHTVQGYAVRALALLDLHAVGVVGTDLVQGQQVQHHQGQQHDGQRHHVQGEEAIQGNARDQVVAAYPGHQVLTHHGDGPEQRDDHLRAPVGHLAPGQHVAHKRLGHEHHENQHAENPDQFPRLLIGTVQQGPEHVQVDDHEKRRCAGGVHVAQHPAVIHLAHDVLDGRESALLAGVVAHGQPDAGQQLVDQYQQGEDSEEIPEIEVLGGVVLAHVGIPGPDYRQAGIDPIAQSNKHIDHQAASASTPITRTSSPSNVYGGTTRFVEAGTPL